MHGNSNIKKKKGLTLFINWRNTQIFREGPVIWKEFYESVLLITCKGCFIKASCCLYIMHANIVRVCSKAIHEMATFTDHEGFWWYDWHFVYIKQQRIIVSCNTQCRCHECQEGTLTVYNLRVASKVSWHPVYLDERTMTWPGCISYRRLVKGIWTLQSININRFWNMTPCTLAPNWKTALSLMILKLILTQDRASDFMYYALHLRR